MSATNPVLVFKGMFTEVRVSLGYDVSNDTFASQIRVGRSQDTGLIADWICSFVTDGSDGELVLTMTPEVSSLITHTQGYMDVKRVTEGRPVPVFETPLVVHFKEHVTA